MQTFDSGAVKNTINIFYPHTMIQKYGTNGPSIIGATGHTQKIIGTATIRENELAQVLDETFKYNLLAVGQDCDSADVSWIFNRDKAMSVRTSLLSHIGEDDIIKYAQRNKGGLCLCSTGRHIEYTIDTYAR